MAFFWSYFSVLDCILFVTVSVHVWNARMKWDGDGRPYNVNVVTNGNIGIVNQVIYFINGFLITWFISKIKRSLISWFHVKVSPGRCTGKQCEPEQLLTGSAMTACTSTLPHQILVKSPTHICFSCQGISCNKIQLTRPAALWFWKRPDLLKLFCWIYDVSIVTWFFVKSESGVKCII